MNKGNDSLPIQMDRRFEKIALPDARSGDLHRPLNNAARSSRSHACAI
jgi:hypothetical protein